MKIACGALAAIAMLIVLTANSPAAEAGSRAHCRQGSCYQGRNARPYAEDGWFSFRFFGDFSGPCGPLSAQSHRDRYARPALLERLRTVHRHLMRLHPPNRSSTRSARSVFQRLALPNSGFHVEGYPIGVNRAERPAPVLVPSLLHQLDRLGDACVETPALRR